MESCWLKMLTLLSQDSRFLVKMLTLLSLLEVSNYFLFGVFSSSFFRFLLCLAVQAALGTAANEKCVCAFSATLVCKWWAPAVLWIDMVTCRKWWATSVQGGQVSTDWYTGRLSIQYLRAAKIDWLKLLQSCRCHRPWIGWYILKCS